MKSYRTEALRELRQIVEQYGTLMTDSWGDFTCNLASREDVCRYLEPIAEWSELSPAASRVPAIAEEVSKIATEVNVANARTVRLIDLEKGKFAVDEAIDRLASTVLNGKAPVFELNDHLLGIALFGGSGHPGSHASLWLRPSTGYDAVSSFAQDLAVIFDSPCNSIVSVKFSRDHAEAEVCGLIDMHLAEYDEIFVGCLDARGLARDRYERLQRAAVARANRH